MEYYSVVKKSKSLNIPATIDGPQNHQTELKKLDIREYILHESTDMKCKLIYSDRKQWVVQGQRQGRDDLQGNMSNLFIVMKCLVSLLCWGFWGVQNY